MEFKFLRSNMMSPIHILPVALRISKGEFDLFKNLYNRMKIRMNLHFMVLFKLRWPMNEGYAFLKSNGTLNIILYTKDLMKDGSQKCDMLLVRYNLFSVRIFIFPPVKPTQAWLFHPSLRPYFQNRLKLEVW